ncbi:MAG: tetratricopeptide repeat protein [Chloroflexi bacterium]|nr:tetratricopeptide repeat protein [Chloroflexota bacterium]
MDQAVDTSARAAAVVENRPADAASLATRLVATRSLPVVVLLLGLALRLAVWWPLRGYEPFGDEQYYYRAALLFAQGLQYVDPPTPAWLPVQRVPLLSLLAGALFRIAGNDLGPVNLVQIGLSLATCWFVWRWAAALWGRSAGLVALAIAVIYPTLITHSASFLYTETLYTFLAAGALYLLGRLGGARGLVDGVDQVDAGEGRAEWPELARGALGWAVAAGLAIGMTALTRSSGLTLLGVALLWLTLAGWRAWRRTALLGLVIIAACALVIAPWTARNYRTYGGWLLLDTIGAYNLWRDNALPGENPAAILVRIANPIEQQRVATERGLHNLLTQPDRFLARLPATALYLWHLELDSYARGGGYFEDLTNRSDSAGWVLYADLAHLAVSGLALVGLALAPWRAGRTPAQRRLQALLLLWIVANLVSGVVFHSEARFRIPYQPQMIVFAALPLAAWPVLWARARRLPWRSLLAVGLLAILAAGAWSPRLAPALHMQAWTAVAALARPWDAGASLAALERAVAAFPASERPHIALGDARRRLGDTAGAMAAYQAALAIQPHNVNAAVPLMRLYLQAGNAEAARQVLRAAGASDADLIAWSWREDDAPPVGRLDIGSGLEYGLLTNMYPPERSGDTTFRWTNGNGLLRLVAPPEGARRLALRLNGTRLGAPPSRWVEVAVNGAIVDTFAATGEWEARVIDLSRLGLPGGAALLVEVRSDTFVPSAVVAGNRDGRRLGIALDSIAVEP